MCLNNARSVLLPSLASRGECSWCELFNRGLKSPSLHHLIERWRRSCVQIHSSAHTLLNPAVCFNCGAKHSIYRPLRPQRTTFLFFFSPHSCLQVSNRIACCQRAFIIPAGATSSHSHAALPVHFGVRQTRTEENCYCQKYITALSVLLNCKRTSVHSEPSDLR